MICIYLTVLIVFRYDWLDRTHEPTDTTSLGDSYRPTTYRHVAVAKETCDTRRNEMAMMAKIGNILQLHWKLQ
jgi:hypothetical protein